MTVLGYLGKRIRTLILLYTQCISRLAYKLGISRWSTSQANNRPVAFVTFFEDEYNSDQYDGIQTHDSLNLRHFET